MTLSGVPWRALFPAMLILFQSAAAAEFAVYDVLIDPQNTPLAAYQLKIRAKDGATRILSVEGGESQAFREPPYYDAKAIQRDIIKIAAYSTIPAEKLPRKKTRVASLHIEFDGVPPRFEAEVQAAATAGGKRISAKAFIERRNVEQP